MVTGMMPREPRWEYRSGRSAIRQMFAASSSDTTSGGSRRPPSRSAWRSPARIAVSDSAAISGAAADRDFDSQVQGVAAVRRTRLGRRPAEQTAAGGVTQAMICGSVIAFAAVRAVW